MRARVFTLLCPLLGSAGLIGSAHAMVPDDHTYVGVEPNRLRTYRPQAQNALRHQDAWQAFTEGDGAGWMARFDEATGTPHRAWGPGIPLRDVSTRAAVDASLRELFAANQAMLGVPLDTLRLRTATYVERMDMWIVDYDRMVGETTGGATTGAVPIWRGGVTVRVRGGEVVLFGVDTYPAWPTLPAPQIDEAAAVQAAELAGPAPMADHSDVSTLLEALPWKGENGLTLKLVYEVHSRTQAPLGKWVTLVDAATGDVLTAWNEVRFFEGTLYGNTNTRTVDGNFSDSPMPLMRFDGSDGSTVYSGLDGSFSLADNVRWTMQVRGSYATVDNQSGGEGSMSVATGDTAPEWTTSDATQAEIDAYKYVHDVRAWSLDIAPEVTMATMPLSVHVNMNQTCNAYFDGDLNFYSAGGGCNNTGEIADVVYHEWGHGFHYYSISNPRDFDGSISEGIADTVATYQTHDAQIGPYFFTRGAPVRDLTDVRVYPDDMDGEVHDEGMIFGGAMWDTWGEMLDTYGEAREDSGTAWRTMATLLANGIKAGPGVADSYDEMVVADDDDGDITNGTPHICELNAGFGIHGLGPGSSGSTASLDHVPLGNQPADTPIPFTGGLLNTAAACSPFTFTTATVHYSTDGGADWSEAELDVSGDGFTGELPGLPDGTIVEYYLTGESAEGQAVALPADLDVAPYSFYVGGLEVLSCNTFEKDDGGYTHELLAGTEQDGADDWMWGTPIGLTTDPEAAYSGRKVWGNDLGGGNFNGEYQSDIKNRLTSAPFDTTGHSSVILQYRRWLGVEDGAYDHARIFANDAQVWENHVSDGGEAATDDQEWKLHTVRVDNPGDALTLAWEMESDRGLEYGGWNLDDVCLYVPLNLNDMFGIDDLIATDTLQHDIQVTWTQPSDAGAVHATVIRRADRYAATKDDVGDGVVVFSGDVAPGSAQAVDDPVDGTWFYSVFAGGDLGWLSGATFGANADEGTGLLDGENGGDGTGDIDTGGGIKINAGCGCATDPAAPDPTGVALIAGLAGLLGVRRAGAGNSGRGARAPGILARNSSAAP